MNLFALRLYLFQFDLDEALRFINSEENRTFSYEPIMEERLQTEGTKENELYIYFKDQIQNYGDLVYLTHLYTNRLWAEWGGIDLPADKDHTFLVLRYIFNELQEEYPIISENKGINDAFFKEVDRGFHYAISDVYDDQLAAHRIFHDLDYWKFNNHLNINRNNTNYFSVFKDIPDGSLEDHKKRQALYRIIYEPK
jgi:hypothetical protein